MAFQRLGVGNGIDLSMWLLWVVLHRGRAIRDHGAMLRGTILSPGLVPFLGAIHINLARFSTAVLGVIGVGVLWNISHTWVTRHRGLHIRMKTLSPLLTGTLTDIEISYGNRRVRGRCWSDSRRLTFV